LALWAWDWNRRRFGIDRLEEAFFVFGVTARNPPTVPPLPSLLIFIALLGLAHPARRATRIYRWCAAI